MRFDGFEDANEKKREEVMGAKHGENIGRHSFLQPLDRDRDVSSQPAFEMRSTLLVLRDEVTAVEYLQR
jgi:hypothetical protein